MAKKKAVTSGNQSVALPNQSASVVQDDQHGILIRWVNEADTATISTRELSEKCRAYYDSNQWTADEKSKLAKQKQAATVINRIKPKIDSLMGMERANRTTAKAQPRTPKETKGATAATEAVRFCLQDNMFERHRSDAWENLLIEGTGGVEVIVRPKDDETYKVIIRHIMWDRLIYDPHSRRKDFSDARFLGQVVWMDYDEAVAKYPDARDVLESMQAGSSTYDDQPRWMDNTRRRVKIVELYYQHTDGDWWYACFTYGGYCEAPKKSPYLNEEGETEHAYCYASLFVERDGGRYGAEKQLLDIQDEINKRRSKALHLNSVRQVRLERGAVEDVNKVRQELAKPDGVIETTPGMEFEILKTGDMLAGQFNLLSEAKMEIDSIGANSATMGKDKTVQSGVALRQRALTGQTELAPMFDILKNLDIRIYRKVWNRIKQYWKAEMWLRVTDDENNLKFVGLNKPMTQGEMMLRQAQEAGMPPEQLQALQQQIAMDPAMQQIVSTENEIVNMDVDIIMDDAPDTVTQEVEDFQAMAEMVKSGFPLPPEAVIMASPLSNKDKIIKMMKEQPQLSPQQQKQMEGMQEQMQTMQQEGQKLAQENQALKQDQQAEAAKLQLEQQKAQAQLELQRAKQEGEAALAQAKAKAEYELKAYCAEQDMALEKMRCDNDQKMGREKMDFEQSSKRAMMETEAQDKMNAQNEAAKADVLPVIVEQLQTAFGQIGELLQQSIVLQRQTLAAIQAPKKVSIGSIQKDANGTPVGATVVSTPTNSQGHTVQ